MSRLLRYPVVLLVSLTAIIAASEFSPVYDFCEPSPFTGPDIYNPYASLDTSVGWKRANFHTHTKVDGLFNECPEYPDAVYADYEKFGYDILAFSNHNELTVHPVDSSLQIDVYEHGINIFQLHKLVFGPDRMILHDVLIPFMPSQKQFEYDYLSRNADFIVMNHPDRTRYMSMESMRKLGGYRLIEPDCGRSTECERWDEALSAGHYSIAITNDDNHNSRISNKIAIRCSWQNVRDATYPEVRRALLSGCGYSMRIPDFGEGDWAVKYRENSDLPSVKWIGLCGQDTVRVEFDRPAGIIQVIGQNHTELGRAENSSSLEYVFRPDDTYARLTAYFDNGVVIYSNPFARYDANETETPWKESPHPVNLWLTLLYNLCVAAFIGGCFYLIGRLLAFPKRKS